MRKKYTNNIHRRGLRTIHLELLHARIIVVSILICGVAIINIPKILVGQIYDRIPDACTSSYDCSLFEVCSVDFGDCIPSQKCTGNNCLSICTGICQNKAGMQVECTSSDQCGQGNRCTTEIGVCNEPVCVPGQPCLATCSGTCAYEAEVLEILDKQKFLESSSSSIASSQSSENIPPAPTEPILDVLTAYIIEDACMESQQECQSKMWVSITKKDGTPLLKSSEPMISLHRWNAETEEYEETGMIGSTVYDTSEQLSAVFFQLPPLPRDSAFPFLRHYKLDAKVHSVTEFWSIKERHGSLAVIPQVIVSDTNELLTPDNQSKPISSVSSSSLSIGSSTSSSATSQSSSSQSAQLSLFTDLYQNEAITVAANDLAVRGIISGYPDRTFRPIRLVNRAEAAKFLLEARFQDIPPLVNTGQFSDVERGQWYEKYVMFAAEKSIIGGYPDGSFRPADTVNTAEFLKMITLTFGLDQNLPYSYIDVSNENWFAKYAGAGALYGLFPKRPGYLLFPNMSMTREEVALAIYEVLQRTAGSNI